MKLSKILALIAMVSLLASVVQLPATAQAQGDDTPKKLGLVLHIRIPFTEQIAQGARDAAKDFGYEVEIVGPPTFDATAQAVNPRARVRPVHRPPRDPRDRRPVCHWEVVIDDDAEPLEEAPITRIVRMSTAATFEFSPVRRDGKKE